jgi:hypothetical protein
VFFNEVGEHISQKGDGNAGGQKFMVAKDMRAQVRNSFKYNHCTVLGFTSEYGRPDMCATLIAASKLKLTDVTGFNPLSKDAEDVSSDEMKVLDDEIAAMKDEHIKVYIRTNTHIQWKSGTNIHYMQQEWQHNKSATHQHVIQNG